MLALDDLSGCKADVRRLSRKPVSFDSAIACDHFKIILILPIDIETFYSRCAAKTDTVAPILLGQIESPIGHRLQRFKLILPRSSLALTPNEALTRSVTLLCKKTSVHGYAGAIAPPPPLLPAGWYSASRYKTLLRPLCPADRPAEPRWTAYWPPSTAPCPPPDDHSDR